MVASDRLPRSARLKVLDGERSGQASSTRATRRCRRVRAAPAHGGRTVAQRLNRFDLISTNETCRAILDATGGWTTLVERCIEDTRTTGDSSAAAERLKSALSTGRGDLRTHFEEAVGLTALSSWRELMAALYTWLPEYEREVVTLSADDLGFDGWRGEDTTVLLQRLGLVRLGADGRLVGDAAVAQLLTP